jgi:hypothetical protein
MEPRRSALRVYTLSRMEKMTLKMLCAALFLAMAAHAATGEPSRTGVAPPKRIPDVVPGVSLQAAGEPVTTASMPRAVRQAVVVDAARRFQVAEDSVVLASAEQITWSDGSLGCPQPGRSYTQALVPGYRVTAATAAGRMLYHTDRRGNVVTCGLPVQPSQKSANPNTRAKGAEPRTGAAAESGVRSLIALAATETNYPRK